MCSGSYIVEVDHDDELTSDCLQVLHDAFKAYPDAGFAYSHTCEMNQDGPADYGDGLVQIMFELEKEILIINWEDIIEIYQLLMIMN